MFCVRAELVSFSAFSAEGAALVWGAGLCLGALGLYKVTQLLITTKIHLLWTFITISTRVLHFYQTFCPLKENHLKLIVLSGSKHFHPAFLVNWKWDKIPFLSSVFETSLSCYDQEELAIFQKLFPPWPCPAWHCSLTHLIFCVTSEGSGFRCLILALFIAFY